jgi:hypothetical protein
VKKPSLDEMITKRVDFLTGYQTPTTPGTPRLRGHVRAAEAPQGGGKPA